MATFQNQKQVTGAYSASSLFVDTPPNFEQPPNLFPSNVWMKAGKGHKTRGRSRYLRDKTRGRRYLGRKRRSNRRKRKMKGGTLFNNTPLSFGYGIDSSNILNNDSMLANPIPIKPYFPCGKVNRS
jgi:hypothetical protein